MKTLENTRTETMNRLGRVFGIVLIVCAAIGRCGGAEISLEPMELLDLPLSKLSAVTAETSATARKLNEQREQEDRKTAEAGGNNEVFAAKSRETDVPVFIGFGSPEDYPFYPYPLLATDAPWLTPPAQEATETPPVQTVAEITPVEDAPETAAVGETADPAPLENNLEPSPVKDAQEPMPSEDYVESAPVDDVREPVVKQRVWEGRITAPTADSYEQMKLELQKVIYQVRAIELEERRAKIISDAELMAMGAAEPNGLPDANEALVAGKKEVEQVRPPYTPVSESTLKALEDMAAKAGTEGAGLANALELAEILYRSGRLEQAAKVYRLAYNAAAADDNVAVENKAWMLLQVGNCLRDIDASGAAEAYKQVVTEYANSMWKDMAKTQLALLNWYASDKPEELVAKNGAKPAGGQLKTEQ